MKTIKIETADSTAQERGYKYNVQILINGSYCGVGKFCKNLTEINEYLERQLTEKEEERNDLLGVYAVKSPYHETTHYLPFIIVNYAKSNNTYNVMTIEYKGLTAYQVDADYTEKSINDLIANGVITKWATPDNFKENKEVVELIRQYSNAENQQI